MGRGEYTVSEQCAVVEKANVGQKLHRRFAVFVHNALKLDKITARMGVYRHIQVLRRRLDSTQQRLATGLDLCRVEHAA
jgi:hypothetical protein